MATQAVVKQEAQVPQVAVSVTPMRLLEIATEKGADIEKLKQLMELQERWEANEAKKAFVQAMSTFKKDPPTIHKNKDANFGAGKAAYSYATLHNVCEQIVQALSRVGISHDWKTQQVEGKVRVTCVLTHVRGHSEATWLEASPDTSGSKNSIQAIGSTVSYLQRYTLLAATGLSVAEMDDDGAGGSKGVGTGEKSGYTDEEFKQVLVDAEKHMAKGKKADQLIIFLESKYALTDDQKKAIKDKEPKA